MRWNPSYLLKSFLLYHSEPSDVPYSPPKCQDSMKCIHFLNMITFCNVDSDQPFQFVHVSYFRVLHIFQNWRSWNRAKVIQLYNLQYEGRILHLWDLYQQLSWWPQSCICRRWCWRLLWLWWARLTKHKILQHAQRYLKSVFLIQKFKINFIVFV